MVILSYITCYVTLKSSAHPKPPQIHLPVRADLQQIESNAYYLLIVRQAQRLNTLQWPRPCLQQEAVAGGRSLLHCLLPFRGLQVGNILVLYPAVLAVPGVVLVFPALFVPVSLLTLFWWVPLKHFVVHSA